jgi:hypothetical protein
MFFLLPLILIHAANNILMRLEGGLIVPQLCDFGSAQHISSPVRGG